MQSGEEAQHFNCYICYQSARRPRMCPSCNKLTCESCLRQWIDERKPQCPHCRKPMLLSSFADCQRLITDIKQFMDISDKDSKDRCKEHRFELRYFCNDCKEPICSDCAMFAAKHRGHAVTHLNKIYQEIRDRISKEVGVIDSKVQRIRDSGLKIKEEMKKLVQSTNTKKIAIENYFLSMMEKLEEQQKQLKDKIEAKYEANQVEMDTAEGEREELLKLISEISERQLIERADKLVQGIKAMHWKEVEYEEENIECDLLQQIVPRYTEFNFLMKDPLNQAQFIVYSPAKELNGMEWRLKIYPHGNGQAKNTHISVFIEMSKAYLNQNKYAYKIELINHVDKKQSISREFESKFDIGECWGYNQFVPIAELNSGFMLDNELHFVASIRAPTYLAHVEDMERHMKVLEKKILCHAVSNAQDCLPRMKIQDKKIQEKKTPSKINASVKPELIKTQGLEDNALKIVDSMYFNFPPQ